jgi:hypothetical protein
MVSSMYLEGVGEGVSQHTVIAISILLTGLTRRLNCIYVVCSNFMHLLVEILIFKLFHWSTHL